MGEDGDLQTKVLGKVVGAHTGGKRPNTIQIANALQLSSDRVDWQGQIFAEKICQ